MAESGRALGCNQEYIADTFRPAKTTYMLPTATGL
jgi:hypothetical protein